MKINLILYANSAPEAKFSNTNISFYCQNATCGRKCKDVKKCIYPLKFQEYLKESFPEYNVPMTIRYQEYSDGSVDKNILRVDAELVKKVRTNFTQNFMNEIVFGMKK